MTTRSDKYGLPQALPMMPPAPAGDQKRVVVVELLGEETEYHSASRARTVTILKLVREDGTSVFTIDRRPIEEARASYIGKIALSSQERDARVAEGKAKRVEQIRKTRFWK